MTLEKILRQRMCSLKPLCDLLAAFNGEPAVFFQTAPANTDDGWDQERYPHLIYHVYSQAVPERKASGSVAVQIWCMSEGVSAEAVETAVRDGLSELITVPEGKPACSVSWMRSSPLVDKARPFVRGIKVQFDIHELNVQESCDPDPVLAVNQWIREEMPDLLVVEGNMLPVCYQPDETTPTVYIRAEELKITEETNTAVWLEGVLAVHLFAPQKNRSVLLRQMGNRWTMEGEIPMLDGSPMRFTDVQINRDANPHTEGQLRLSVTFGLLRRAEYKHILNVAEVR